MSGHADQSRTDASHDIAIGHDGAGANNNFSGLFDEIRHGMCHDEGAGDPSIQQFFASVLACVNYVNLQSTAANPPQ